MILPRSPLALLVPVAVALSACSGVNGGATTVADFDDWLAAHPFDGMRVVETSTAENLPFSGSAGITVAVDDTDVGPAAEHVCGFEPRGANSVELTVQAAGIGVPVDCADPAATATTWGVLAGLGGLQEVSIRPTELRAVFEDDADALAAWDALRDVGSSSRYVVEVVGRWTLTDEPGTTPTARSAARAALTSIYIVERITISPETPARPEQVEVEVAFDAPVLRRELLEGHPERQDLVTVTETPRIPSQVSSSASSRRRTTSSPTRPITSR